MQCKEPITPQDPRELRDPRDGEPNGRSQGTLAEGRKCHRVSFASKWREKRGMRGEEGGGRSEATGGRKDEERLRQGRVEGGRTEEGKGGRRDRIAFTSPFRLTLHKISAHSSHGSCPPGSATYGQLRDAPHTDRAPLGGPLTVPESKFAWRPSAHAATPFTRKVHH